ncbi:MAG: winged helix-turn-helix transcriptional regulator [Candidatus Heimdallarchaeota archaeon]|nr:MAG: winged helix-turn-helix transcriptional regulator [Candidatus Heimdallarchaeota archaeon]
MFISPVCSSNLLIPSQSSTVQSSDIVIRVREILKPVKLLNLPIIFLGRWTFENHQNDDEKIPVNRSIIKETIEESPGITLREIQRETGLAIGVIQYHIGRLETTEIEAFILGRCKHFFLKNHQFSIKEKMWFSVLRNKNVKTILQFLESKTSVCLQKDIVNFTGISKVMVSYYVKQLEQFGIISRRHHQLKIAEDYLNIINDTPNIKIN